MFKNKKIIFSNFFSLSLLEISNYLFPLITLPYVVRTLGPDNYGFLAISVAITNYLLIIVGYGFNIWATKEIAQNKTLDYRNYIFSGVIYSKLFIAILILFFSYTLLLFLDIDRVLRILLMVSFLLVIPNIFYPIWFFQGIQKMHYLTIFHFLLKLINMILIFTLINDYNDFYLVPLFTLLSSTFISIISLILLYRNFKIKFIYLNLNQITSFLIKPFQIFLNHFWDTFHTNLPILSLSFFVSPSEVAYFSVAEKIVNALSNILKTFSRAIFPFFASIINNSVGHAKELINKIGMNLFFITLLVVLLVNIFSSQIIEILFGEDYFASILILKVLSFFCLFTTLKQFIITQGLINFNRFNLAAKVPFYGSLLSLFLMPLITFFYGPIGLSFTIVLLELILFIIAIAYYIKIVKN